MSSNIDNGPYLALNNEHVKEINNKRKYIEENNEENEDIFEKSQNSNKSKRMTINQNSSLCNINQSFRWILFDESLDKIQIESNFDISDLKDKIKEKNAPECMLFGACRLIVEYPVGQTLSAGTPLNLITGGLEQNDPIIVSIPKSKQQTGKTYVDLIVLF